MSEYDDNICFNRFLAIMNLYHSYRNTYLRSGEERRGHIRSIGRYDPTRIFTGVWFLSIGSKADRQAGSRCEWGEVARQAIGAGSVALTA